MAQENLTQVDSATKPQRSRRSFTQLVLDAMTYVAAAAAGVAWLVWHGGGQALRPMHVDWLLQSDWANHFLGWAFFRNEKWAFPLGHLAGAHYPLGTSVAMTDSNPLLAIPFKLVSDYLPTNFQYIGLWLAACFALQGVAGTWLTAKVLPSRLTALLGGIFFATAPALMQRLEHDTLCAHFLILGALGFAVPAPTTPKAARCARVGAGSMVLIASTVHPYITAMVFSIYIAILVAQMKSEQLSRQAGLQWTVGLLAPTVAIFFLFGYVGQGANAGSFGLGDYNASVLTFFDPRRSSRLLPALSISNTQHEGFAFLGLGSLLLWATTAYYMHRHQSLLSSLRAMPRLLVACAAAGAVFAMIPWFPPGIEQALSPFRSSGRFIWPAYYLLMLAPLVVVGRSLGAQTRKFKALLAAAVLIQIADANPHPTRQQFVPSALTAVDGAGWELATDYRHLAFFPASVFGNCDTWDGPQVTRYTYRAYRSKLTFNSGCFSRLNPDLTRAQCASEIAEVKAGTLDPSTIYVVRRPQDIATFTSVGATCGHIDADLATCVLPQAGGRLTDYLHAHPL